MNLFEYVQNGGPIMYILVLINIIGLSIVLWKFLSLVGYKRKLTQWSDEIIKSFQNRLKGADVNDSLKLEIIKDDIIIFVKRLESGLNTIKTIASIAPLLGLLGTVIGILSAFDVISKKGLDDPSLFAGGISMALLTTVAGLIVAIPHFVGHNYLTKLIDDIETDLEEVTVPKVL